MLKKYIGDELIHYDGNIYISNKSNGNLEKVYKRQIDNNYNVHYLELKPSILEHLESIIIGANENQHLIRGLLTDNYGTLDHYLLLDDSVNHKDTFENVFLNSARCFDLVEITLANYSTPLKKLYFHQVYNLYAGETNRMFSVLSVRRNGDFFHLTYDGGELKYRELRIHKEIIGIVWNCVNYNEKNRDPEELTLYQLMSIAWTIYVKIRNNHINHPRIDELVRFDKRISTAYKLNLIKNGRKTIRYIDVVFYKDIHEAISNEFPGYECQSISEIEVYGYDYRLKEIKINKEYNFLVNREEYTCDLFTLKRFHDGRIQIISDGDNFNEKKQYVLISMEIILHLVKKSYEEITLQDLLEIRDYLWELKKKSKHDSLFIEWIKN
ncbi:hypothetical protein LLR47_17575 [Bacillus cereus]|uniref:hypothetical protein n=1 Tax=Bacillus cereus TaxID=1396 RepID=UPI001D151DF8|nr:hypothetical protein [Bacillus cereus]MCC3687041.1 hypothetical protein [Bacillus cereus]